MDKRENGKTEKWTNGKMKKRNRPVESSNSFSGIRRYSRFPRRQLVFCVEYKRFELPLKISGYFQERFLILEQSYLFEASHRIGGKSPLPLIPNAGDVRERKALRRVSQMVSKVHVYVYLYTGRRRTSERFYALISAEASNVVALSRFEGHGSSIVSLSGTK